MLVNPCWISEFLGSITRRAFDQANGRDRREILCRHLNRSPSSIPLKCRPRSAKRSSSPSQHVRPRRRNAVLRVASSLATLILRGFIHFPAKARKTAITGMHFFGG